MVALYFINFFSVKNKISKRNLVLALLLTILIGIIWELHEWLLDIYTKVFFKERGIECCLGTPADTFKDVVMDTLGGLVAIALNPKIKKK